MWVDRRTISLVEGDRIRGFGWKGGIGVVIGYTTRDGRRILLAETGSYGRGGATIIRDADTFEVWRPDL